jgi:hypothetical protein
VGWFCSGRVPGLNIEAWGTLAQDDGDVGEAMETIKLRSTSLPCRDMTTASMWHPSIEDKVKLMEPMSILDGLFQAA